MSRYLASVTYQGSTTDNFFPSFAEAMEHCEAQEDRADYMGSSIRHYAEDAILTTEFVVRFERDAPIYVVDTYTLRADPAARAQDLSWFVRRTNLETHGVRLDVVTTFGQILSSRVIA